jgi:hypothetical protein
MCTFERRPLIIAPKYRVIFFIEDRDVFRVSHLHNLSLPLLEADTGRRPHKVNCTR